MEEVYERPTEKGLMALSQKVHQLRLLIREILLEEESSIN